MFVLKDSHGVIINTVKANRTQFTGNGSVIFETVTKNNGVIASVFVAELAIVPGMSIIPV